MKKLVLCLMIAAGAFCRASEFQLFVVPQLNPENMVSFKKSLASHIGSVRTTKYLVYGAMAVGACEIVRRFFASHAQDAVTVKDHSELLHRVDELERERGPLERRVHGLEKGKQVPSTDWIPWMKGRAQAFGRKVDEWVPSWISNIAKMYAISQATSIVWRKIPQVDGYIGFNPTINWCMFNGTSLMDGLGGFKNWQQAMIMQPGKHFNEDPELPVMNLNKKSFALCSHALVSSMEQVLGYMGYVTEKLKPDDKNYLLLKARSEVCMEAISAEMVELIELMNLFLGSETVNAHELGYLLEAWHLKVILILDHLEDFEAVTLAVGFAERDGTGGRFNEIRSFIAPQIPGKPEPQRTVGPLEEAVTDTVAEVAEKVASVSRYL